MGRSDLVDRAKRLALDFARSGEHPAPEETLGWLAREGFALRDVQVPGSFDWVLLEYARGELRVRLSRDRGLWAVDLIHRDVWLDAPRALDMRSIESALRKVPS